MNLQQIHTSTDPRIQVFRLLKGDSRRLGQEKKIIVEGDQQVERLLRSSFEIETLFLEGRYYSHFEPLIMAKSIPSLFVATRELMEQIVGYRLHQGVFALAKRPPEAEPSQLNLPLIILNHVSDPENVGSIMRSAAAFNIPALLSDELSADPFSRRAIRVSMGGIFSMQISTTEHLINSLETLGNYVEIVAIENTSQAVPCYSRSWNGNFALIFGNERNGIDKNILKKCHTVVQIPMMPSNVSSLNVGVAAAIVFSSIYQHRTTET